METNQQKPASSPSFLSKVGSLFSDAISSSSTYKAPVVINTYTPSQAVVKPPVAFSPVSPAANVVAPNPQYQQGIQNAYKLYPEVPKGLIEAVMMQESSMGTNAANRKNNAGQFGWLGGITKTGAYADMVKNKKTDYGAWNVPGAKDLSTPHGAIAVVASILAQKIRQNYGGKISPEQVFELYDKYYKTKSGFELSDKQRKDFMNYFTHYASQ